MTVAEIAERALDIIYRYRLKPVRGFEYVSPAVTRVTGFTPEEHYSDPDLGFKLVHPEDRQALLAMTQAPPTPAPLPLRWIHKDGSVIWTEQRNTPVYDEHGEMVAIEGIAREIDDPTRRPGETLRVFAGLRINLALQRVIVDGAVVRLTPSEFKLLALLTEHAGEVVTADQIMQHLWQSEHGGTRHSCETHVSTLRRKIERDRRHPERIVTVRGRGYRFAAPSAAE